MKYYAVIDTNVVVSAMLKADSTPGKIMEQTFIGQIIPVLNEKIVDEYYDVLRRPKFRFDEAAVEIIMKELLKRGIFVNAEDTDEKLPDSGDQIFYNVVMEKRKTEETWLVTGNIKHFPERSFVVTPREMLDMLNQK